MLKMLRRFPYTIALIVGFLVIGGVIYATMHAKAHRCEQEGGFLAMKWPYGYACTARMEGHR